MNKTEYIDAVKKELGFLPSEEIVKAEGYFESFFCSSLSDEEIISGLGTPKEAAKRYCKSHTEQTKAEQNQTEQRTQTVRPQQEKRSYAGIVTAVIAGVFLFPIWFPIVILIAALIFALLIGIVGVCFGLWLGGGFAVLGSLFANITFADKLIGCGGGFIMFGVGLILSWLLVRAFIGIGIWIVRKITRS